MRGGSYRRRVKTSAIIIGPEYEALYVDIGVNSCNSDGTVLSKCALKNALERYILNVPIPTIRKVPVERFKGSK